MALNLYGRANRLARTGFVDAGERLGVRPRATARMIDEIVDAAQQRPDRCGDTGFDDRQTGLLVKMLQVRIASLKETGG